jgi:hypothetical protein
MIESTQGENSLHLDLSPFPVHQQPTESLAFFNCECAFDGSWVSPVLPPLFQIMSGNHKGKKSFSFLPFHIGSQNHVIHPKILQQIQLNQGKERLFFLK